MACKNEEILYSNLEGFAQFVHQADCLWHLCALRNLKPIRHSKIVSHYQVDRCSLANVLSKNKPCLSPRGSISLPSAFLISRMASKTFKGCFVPSGRTVHSSSRRVWIPLFNLFEVTQSLWLYFQTDDLQFEWINK